MPILVVLAVLANGFLCVLLTMRECKIESARVLLIIQVFGMGLFWCVFLAGANVALNWALSN